MAISKKQGDALYSKANYLVGGHHTYGSYAQMQNIPAYLRAAGMFVTVLGDATASLDGVYELQADLVTFSLAKTAVTLYSTIGQHTDGAMTQKATTDALSNKADLVGGIVPTSQLPAYVDEVLEVAAYAALPAVGGTSKIYITVDNNKQFRWSGTMYVEIAKSAVLYPSVGQNTDGAMTQKATSDELALRAPLDSPALTGLPTTPLAPAWSNNTLIASTSYVDRATNSQPITYRALRNLVSASTLIPTRWYQLIDFRTTHNIVGVNNGTVINTGAVEPLFLQASSANTLSPRGYSATYPQDDVYYSISNLAAYPGSTYGTVYRRTDTAYKNDIPFDFRAVVFRRWKSSTGTYTEYNDRYVPNSNDYVESPIFNATGYAAGNFQQNNLNGYRGTLPFDSINMVADATSFIRNLTMTNSSVLNGVTLATRASVSGVYMDAGQLVNVYFNTDSRFWSVNMRNGIFSSNTLNNSVLDTVQIDNSNLSSLTMVGGGISDTRFLAGSVFNSSSISGTINSGYATLSGWVVSNSTLTNMTVTNTGYVLTYRVVDSTIDTFALLGNVSSQNVTILDKSVLSNVTVYGAFRNFTMSRSTSAGMVALGHNMAALSNGGYYLANRLAPQVVATVNGVVPDKNGNVAITVGSVAAPLYSTTGQNTDGAMTQKATTDALSNKADLVNGFVPASQLPSYVDDVLEFASLNLFPGTGETGKIYVAIDSSKQYRWSGSAYVVLSDSGLTADELAAAHASHSPSQTNPFATIADIPTDVKVKAIRVIAATRERQFYTGIGTNANPGLDGLRQAIADAVAGDTVQQITKASIYVTSTGDQALLNKDVNYDTGGFDIDARAISDGLIITDGTGVVHGRNSTVYNNLRGSWGLGFYDGASKDMNYRVYDLHLHTTVDGGQYYANPFSVFLPNCNVYHSGDIYAESLISIYVNNGFGFAKQLYEHVGKVILAGTCLGFNINTNAKVIQRGDVVLRDNATAGVIGSGCRLEMRGGVLDLRNVPTGSGFLMDSTATLVLIDVTVLGSQAPGKPSGSTAGARVELYGETTLQTDGWQWSNLVTVADYRPVVTGGTGVDPVFTILPTETVGGISSGQSFTGTSQQFWTKALVKYQYPGFTQFSMDGHGSIDVERGTALGGASVFNWATSNSQNITPPLVLSDVTAGATLSGGQPVNGSVGVTTTAYTATLGETRRYRMTATNTQGTAFAADLTINGRLPAFYGAGNATPSTSGDVRALGNGFLVTGGGTFTLNTGVNKVFSVWLPLPHTITDVFDVDALRAPLKSQYIGSALTIQDVAGANIDGTLYVMSPAKAYAGNHRHEISFS